MSGVDLSAVLFDLGPVPQEIEGAGQDWTPEPEPSDAELVAEGVKGLLRRPAELAGQAVGALSHPGRAGGRGAPRPPRAWARSCGRG